MGTTNASGTHSPRLISTTEACERLSCSPAFLRGLLGTEIAAVRLGRVFKVDEASLEAYLQRAAVRPVQ